MNKKQILIFVLSYSLCGLAFPPFNLDFATFFLWVPVFYLTTKLTVKQAFFYHTILSIPYNVIMYYWISNVFQFTPGSSLFIGLFLLLFLFCLLSGYIGILFVWSYRSRFFLILFPTLWVGFEVFRTQGDISFPWFHLGYSLGEFLPLIQFSSWVGVFGLSFLIILCNLLILKAYQKDFFSKLGLLFLISALCIPIFLWLFGLIQLSSIPKDELKENSFKKGSIHIVQPDIPQELKWERSLFYTQMSQILLEMKQTSFKEGDLFVLPESVIAHFLKDVPDIFYEWLQWAKENKVALVFGSLDFKKNNHPVKLFVYYNSAFFLNPEFSKIEQVFETQYSKIHLVPFSEKLPFDEIFSFLDFINLGEGDFVKGKGPVIWNWKEIKYSPVICYEIVYPYFIRNIKNQGAEVILNLTNDSWFGKTSSPYQHANIARFRSIELGIPIIRSVNGGISIHYDTWGRIVSKTKLSTRTILTTTVKIRPRTTIYQNIGSILEGSFLCFWIGFHFWIFITYWRKRKRECLILS